MSFAPLFRKDLSMLARRRRWVIARSVTIGLLLLITFPLFINLALIQATRMSASMPAIIHGFFLFFVWTQFVLVIAASPALGTSTLGDAKERAVVDLLRLASISRPSLAFSKLAGASLWPVLLGFGALPFLTIWALWGGTRGSNLLAIVLLTVSTAIACVGFGLVAAASTRSTGAGLVLAYALMGTYALVPLLLSPVIPFRVRVALHAPSALYAVLSTAPAASRWPIAVAINLGLTVAFGVLASVVLMLGDFASRRLRSIERERRSRRVWGWPVLWREFQIFGSRKVSTFVLGCWVLSVILVCIGIFVPSKSVADVCTYGAYTAVPWLVYAVLGSATVAAEKEARTISTLLLADEGPVRIILSKYAGVMARGLPMFLPPLVHALSTGQLRWVFGVMSSALIAGYLGAFGVLCSVIFKKTTSAVAGMLVGIVLQVFCSCNLIGYFIVALPAQLLNSPNLLSLEQQLYLGMSAMMYIVILAGTLGVSIGLFESQARRAV